MGCACASQQKVGHPGRLGSSGRDVSETHHTPAAIVPPPSLQYLVQCNHCGARLELCVPPDTAPGIRIETSCAGCQRLLQVRLGAPGRPRRNAAEGLPTSSHTLLNRSVRGRTEFSDSGEKALKEAIDQRKRANLVNELPREKYCCRRHKELSECEFCLEEYKDG